MTVIKIPLGPLQIGVERWDKTSDSSIRTYWLKSNSEMDLGAGVVEGPSLKPHIPEIPGGRNDKTWSDQVSVASRDCDDGNDLLRRRYNSLPSLSRIEGPRSGSMKEYQSVRNTDARTERNVSTEAGLEGYFNSRTGEKRRQAEWEYEGNVLHDFSAGKVDCSPSADRPAGSGTDGRVGHEINRRPPYDVNFIHIYYGHSAEEYLQ